MNLLEKLKECKSNGVAMGHFNIGSFDMLKAISNVAKRLDVSMVIGTSEGEWNYLEPKKVVNMIRAYNEEFEKLGNLKNCKFYLNGDHTHSIEGIKVLAEAGYDMVIFDSANLGFEENIKKTKEAVLVVKSINPNILVEAELGYIGKSSKLLDKIPNDVSIKLEDLPTAEEADRFVKETGIDLLAPAVGNIHGMMKNAKNPNLYIERIKEIKNTVSTPLVLHGGSGISDEDFREAIKAGISLIHISTEIRNAWRNSFIKSFNDNKEEIAPYRVIKPVIKSIEEVIENRLKLFMELK